MAIESQITRADLARHPVTDDELMFVNLILLHLSTVLTADRKGALTKPVGLRVDVANLFSFPRTAWEKMKRLCDHVTVAYVESLLSAEGAASATA